MARVAPNDLRNQLRMGCWPSAGHNLAIARPARDLVLAIARLRARYRARGGAAACGGAGQPSSKILFSILKSEIRYNSGTKCIEGSEPATPWSPWEAKTLPPLKILSAKTVNTYVATNKTIDARGESDETGMAKFVIVKKKPVSKKRSAASSDAPVVKKTRTTTGKAASKKRDLGLVSVAPEAVPIQMIEPISAVPAERPPAPKRNALKRKFRRQAGSDDEIVDKEPAVEEPILDQSAGTKKMMELETTAEIDDVDTIIEQILADTALMETDAGETYVEGQVEKRSDETERMINVTADEFSALDFHVFTNEAERLVETGSDTEDEMETAMKEESEPLSKPTKIKFYRGIEIRGVEAGDWYKENLPKIATTDKGKKPLEEPDTVKGHPAREQFQLICGDIDFLILLRQKVIKEMTSFFHSFSLRNLKVMRSVKDIFSKEEKMLVWAETDSLKKSVHRRIFIIAKYRELLLRKFLVARRTNLVLGQPTTAIEQQILDLLSAAHQQAVRNLLIQMRTHELNWTRPYSSMLFEEPNIDRGFFIPRYHKTIFSTCWIRNLWKVEGSWLVEDGFDHVVVGIWITPPDEAAEEQKHVPGDDQYDKINTNL
ncbi:hypothetical protein F511_11999 [Dorcoceras hygrometricum]|uniref:Splicing factor 3B subunit 1-like n=1 Tax=Dorcoceras hygrometricum TaxID=472368 RepID=A0A2Z7D8N0_9LAMI|nr:hypothetical protein F511_11999 [Dorcoceras hygrometricum]